MDIRKSAKKILGEDIFEQIRKSDVGHIYKPRSGSGVAIDEIRMSLQIVPRAILSYLTSHLKDMKDGETKEMELPFVDAKLTVNKISDDVYHGEFYSNGRVVSEFKHRTIPAIGVIMMTTFELYDVKEIPNQQGIISEDVVCRLQKIIDERLYLRNLIQSVVREEISQKEAIERYINQKVSSVFKVEDEEVKSSNEDDKKSKLRDFLERKKEVVLDKASLECPDCGNVIHKKEELEIKPCICFGVETSIKLKKKEKDTYVFKFPKSFDEDNRNMLLEIINKE